MSPKAILLFFILSSFSLISRAQIPEISIRGGLNFSTTGGIHAINNRFKPGVHIGGFGTLPITDFYAIESGISYSLKGTVINNPTTLDTHNLHYLDLPVLSRLRIIDDIYIMAGPQISFLMASVSTYNINGVKIRDSSVIDYRRVDFGLHLGAAYDLQNQLMLGLGYDLGLSTLDKTGKTKTFNRLIKLSLFYRLN